MKRALANELCVDAVNRIPTAPGNRVPVCEASPTYLTRYQFSYERQGDEYEGFKIDRDENYLLFIT